MQFTTKFLLLTKITIVSNCLIRIIIILFIYTGVIFIYTLYIQSIGSSISIYDDLFSVALLSQLPINIKNNKSQYHIKKAKGNLHWKNIFIPLQAGSTLTNKLIDSHVNMFWKDVVEKINDDQHILFLFRIQKDNGQFLTLGKLQQLNKEDKKYIIEYISNIIELQNNYYLEMPIIKLAFSYGIRDGKAIVKSQVQNTNYHNYYHYLFPITFNPLEYGKLIFHSGNNYIVQINLRNVAVIETKEGVENCVKIYKEGQLIFEYTDKYIDQNSYCRVIGKNKFTFINNELHLTVSEKTSSFIKKVKAPLKFNTKFITFDIETFLDNNNKHTPYCVSIFDGLITESFYLSDYKNSDDLLLNSIKYLLKAKYNNYRIYIHNLSNFDGIFILKIICKLGLVSPVINKGRIISLQLNFNSKYVIYFYDSFQLLPISLRNLAQSFSVSNKGIFPYSFVQNNNINYIGKVPDYKYFSDITMDEYKNYLDKFPDNKWNLREETIKYCQQDVITLYQILHKFASKIFELSSLNITNYPTLPSLSFGIFRFKYLEENTIPQISGQISKDIRQGFTGGAVDSYIPEGENIYHYDVNSLYPYVMANCYMPIGSSTFFKGDIRKFNKDAFGFFHCKIQTPEYLEHPILQFHVLTKDGIRTVAPLGKMEGVIFSAEMDNALLYGYKFEILWGYTYEKAKIFSKFIEDFYNMRKTFPKTDPMNLIAKLLMNSQYGRYGMVDSFPTINIFDLESYKSFEKKHISEIENIIEIGDENILVEHKSEEQELTTLLDSNYETHNVNVAIACAITAYARIHMSQFKNNPKYKLYYTDTDSIFIDRPLPDDQVSSTELGKMKLENICKKAIFLAPKVYCLLTPDDKFIYKVKGLNHDCELSFKDFDDLLYKDSKLEKNQEKWFKSLKEGSINVKPQLYTLKVTSNKRGIIYNSEGKFINTKPYQIDEIRINKKSK